MTFGRPLSIQAQAPAGGLVGEGESGAGEGGIMGVEVGVGGGAPLGVGVLVGVRGTVGKAVGAGVAVDQILSESMTGRLGKILKVGLKLLTG